MNKVLTKNVIEGNIICQVTKYEKIIFNKFNRLMWHKTCYIKGYRNKNLKNRGK
jgi:hypothetical protein